MAITNLRHPERLSASSSGSPWFTVSQDVVEDDEELSHAGDEGLFAGFAGGSEFLVVGSDERVFPAGDEGGHREAGADRGAAAGDGAAAAQHTAVTVDRGHPDQGGDLAAGETAEFGQFGDQDAPGCRADAGDTGPEIGIGLPGRAAADCAVDVALEFGEFGLPQGQMPFDGAADT